MIVGVPKEIKVHEYRVGLRPAGVRELVAAGHRVLIESNAGLGVGLTNDEYIQAGAEIVDSAEAIFSTAELVVKVKEPQPVECKQLREGQILFTYLHLAPDPVQTQLLIESGVTAVAYETVTDDRGGLPLLAPMSEVAGRMSVQVGAACLEKARGGSGVLLGGIPGVGPGHVTVIGGGVVGLNAARIAVGVGADVTVLDRSFDRLRSIDDMYGRSMNTLFSTTEAIEKQLEIADLVIGAVLIPGAAAPKLVTRDNLSLMKMGSVLVDVAIDQGGCFETSKPTTHDEPTFVVDDVIHYCVANMPGGVARTSTFGLTNATLRYVQALANHGTNALKQDKHLLAGLNVHKGQMTCEEVAQALNYTYVDPLSALA